MPLHEISSGISECNKYGTKPQTSTQEREREYRTRKKWGKESNAAAGEVKKNHHRTDRSINNIGQNEKNNRPHNTDWPTVYNTFFLE